MYFKPCSIWHQINITTATDIDLCEIQKNTLIFLLSVSLSLLQIYCDNDDDNAYSLGDFIPTTIWAKSLSVKSIHITRSV